MIAATTEYKGENPASITCRCVCVRICVCVFVCMRLCVYELMIVM